MLVCAGRGERAGPAHAARAALQCATCWRQTGGHSYPPPLALGSSGPHTRRTHRVCVRRGGRGAGARPAARTLRQQRRFAGTQRRPRRPSARLARGQQARCVVFTGTSPTQRSSSTRRVRALASRRPTDARVSAGQARATTCRPFLALAGAPGALVAPPAAPSAPPRHCVCAASQPTQGTHATAPKRSCHPAILPRASAQRVLHCAEEGSAPRVPRRAEGSGWVNARTPPARPPPPAPTQPCRA